MSSAAQATDPGAIRYIPLSQLRPSPRNVRKTASSTIKALAASIKAHQLRQNLNVTAVGEFFEVEAGERRRQALLQLVAQGDLPADFAVPCMVSDVDAAGEISLAENTMRESMHPADQFEAFHHLVSEGAVDVDIAARFGVTVLFVRQRLKLAKVSAKILKAFRDGKLSLEAVEAYAISNDHARQERAYKQGAVHAHHIRRVLTEGEIETSDRRVRFVTLAAYEAAGGAVRQDMFASGDAPGYVLDRKLLEQLVDAKLEAAAGKLRAEGFGFVEVGADLDTWKYSGTGAAPKDKSKCGALVTIRHDGSIDIRRNVLKPGQRDDSSSGRGKAKAKPAKKPGELSFAQVQQLQAARTGALRGHLVDHPRVAMAALAATLLIKLLRGPELHASAYDYESSTDDAVRIGAREQYNDRVPVAVRDALDKHPGQVGLAAKIADFKKRTPKKGQLFEWLLSEPEATTHEALTLAAAAAAMTVDPVPKSKDAGAVFCSLAKLDMRKHWKVTPDWLTQQPGKLIAHAVLEGCGKTAAAELAKCKGKAAIVAKATQLLSAPGVDWLPGPLRTAPQAKPAAAAAKKPAAARAPAKKAARKKAAKPAARKPAKKASK